MSGFSHGSSMTPSHATARIGLLMMIAGSAVDSTSGLFTRIIGADGFTLTAGRGFFAFLMVLAILFWRDGLRTFSSLMSVGLTGLILIGCNAMGMMFNIVSLSYTGVANFFMIFATAPFAAAVAARLVLGERLDVATLLAAIAGFIGIAVMMLTGAKGGALIGDLLAVACVLSFSLIVLLVRRAPKLDILPVSCLTVLTSGFIGLPFADFSVLDGRGWSLMALFGMVQLAIGNLLIFYAMQRIPAAQSGLLGILNAAFAPLWVFAFLGEVPTANVLLGGAIILGSSLLHVIWTMTRPHPIAA
ncbi:MAG: DMT family transporter [Proteobacteria bacterium]|nr:DMT family transporter [Pseudomonadota bacterium]